MIASTRRVEWWSSALLLVAFGTGCATTSTASGRDGLPARRHAPADPTTIAAAPSTTTAAVGNGGPDWTARADLPPYQPSARRRLAAPATLDIPSIGVRSALVGLGLASDGTMQTPSNTDEAGWYVFAATPGEIGPAVIVGHVDSRTGPAVFYRLHDLHRGDRITITHTDGTRTTFVVTGSQPFAKSRFPTAAVFGATAGASLRLVTCSGVFDRRSGHYVDDLVVFARPDGAAR